jgi:hypothetical protein
MTWLFALLPVGLGLFCVVAAAIDLKWFFDTVLVMSPLRILLPERIARVVLRCLVAALGSAVVGLGGYAGVQTFLQVDAVEQTSVTTPTGRSGW